MDKPILLTVDDDPAVLRAIERDLRNRYAANYRVVRADSGAVALGVLEELKRLGQHPALLLVDHRMPGMTGIEFLVKAVPLFPSVKRVLLTAYADTDAAIRAINEIALDHYLLKPWDPPEDNLYPVIDDLLEEWQANFHPPFHGVRVIGNRWAARSHEIKDFLARNQLPYRWMDLDSPADAKEIQEQLSAMQATSCFPIVLLPDGRVLSDPSVIDLADQLGLQSVPQKEFYDLAIVGSGPAGLAAAVYGASEGLRTVMVEKEAPGGQAGQSSRIENYLGFPSGLSGADLARRGVSQAKRFGVEILTPQEAMSFRAEGPYRILQLAGGREISCHALMIASGVQWRRMTVPGMERLHGAGVYYGAAMTEAISCSGETVYVVGGANSAGQGAMHFSRYAEKVVMLVRGESLAATMSQYLIDQIGATPNISVWTKTAVTAAHGQERLEALTLLDVATGQERQVEAKSLFIFIGAHPKTEWLGEQVMRDANGFVLTGPALGKRPPKWPLQREPYLLETSVPGVFAAGDVRSGSVKRVATSVGDGAVVISFVHQYLANL